MSIEVVKAGLMDTVQDNGRYGYAHWGVNPSGSMDRFAAQVANALVGNPLSMPVIEVHFPAGTFRFTRNALVGLAGADFDASVDGVRIPPWRSVAVSEGAVLMFNKKRKGCRCYIAVDSGLDIPLWLGSGSTNLKIGVGGHHGRNLKSGDFIRLNPSRFNFDTRAAGTSILPWTINVAAIYSAPGTIRFIHGNEWEWLSASARANFGRHPFRVSAMSDRMATRLIHDALEFVHREELLSSGVSFGMIQALPNGELVVLMADHQTTGGYPRIGHIISADLPKFAQLDASAEFFLHATNVEEAEKMLLSLQSDLRKIQQACMHNLVERYGGD